MNTGKRETLGYLIRISNKCMRQRKDTVSQHHIQLRFLFQ